MGMPDLLSAKRKEREVKCVIVGDGAVGKTSMLLSYTTGGIMMDYIPTCFDCYTVDMKVREKNYTMSIIDTAGQETYDRLRTLSYYDTDVFIVCFSVADEDSFQNIKTKWIPELRQYRPDTPFILVGTQCDHRVSKSDPKLSSVHCTSSFSTQTSMTSSELSNNAHETKVQCVPNGKAKSLARKSGAKQYLECSALEGVGIKEIFSSAMTVAVSPKRRRTPSFLKTIKSMFRKKDTEST
ncbi:cell division control protein 42 homolog isoform X2 [Mya arenaria]|nr:cell division control protein 42 homolog isoform X2 [Mya arenaria]